MNSKQYLDAIRKRHNVTDYAASTLIGVTKQAISAVRLGKQGFGEKSALRIAELLDLSPHQVIANLMAEKAANDDVRKVWREIASKFAACLLLAISLTVTDQADANPPPGTTTATDDCGMTDLYYVK